MIKKIILAATLMAVSSVTLANVCKDDPRMHTIGSVAKKLEAGEVIKPLKLSAETFLNLRPFARKIIGDNMLVMNQACLPYQVYQGQLPTKIEVSFSELSNALKLAFLRGDQKLAMVIMTQFKPVNETTNEIVSMLAEIKWPNKSVQGLYESGLFNKAAQDNEKQTESCREKEANISLLELYSAIGGQASDKKPTILSFHGSVLSILVNEGNENNNYSYMTLDENTNKKCSGFSQGRVHNSLIDMGIRPFKTSDDSMSDLRIIFKHEANEYVKSFSL